MPKEARPPLVDAALVGIPEFHGQGDLRILGAHAEEGGHPHPEHGPGAAGEDGAGDTGDVARAHRARQGGGHRLEGGQVVPVLLILLLEEASQGAAHDVAEFAHLEEAGARAEQHAGAHQQHQHDGAPGKGVDLTVDGSDSRDEIFHILPSTVVCSILAN